MEGLEELEKIKKFQFTYPILRIGKEKRETTTVGKIFEKELSIIEKELKKGIAARKFLVAITREYTKEDFEGFTIDDLNDEIKEHGISYTFTQEELDLLKEEILCQ